MSNKSVNTVPEIVEALLIGSHELVQFPGLIEDSPRTAKRVLERLLDRAREYRMEAETLKLQIGHLKELVNNRAYKVPHEACIQEFDMREVLEYNEED